jgi:hypothetical protein
MPSAKGQAGALPPAVVHFLAFGELPVEGRDDRTGLVAAFKLKHAPDRADALGALWSRHADEITAATPEGAEPWVARALADPDAVEREAEAQDDEADDEHDEANPEHEEE